MIELVWPYSDWPYSSLSFQPSETLVLLTKFDSLTLDIEMHI